MRARASGAHEVLRGVGDGGFRSGAALWGVGGALVGGRAGTGDVAGVAGVGVARHCADSGDVDGAGDGAEGAEDGGHYG